MIRSPMLLTFYLSFFSIAACQGNIFVDPETRKAAPSFSCTNEYENRGGICVRTADQCPSSLVTTDDSCMQTPCNNDRYYNGLYCVVETEEAPLNLEDTPIPDFSTSCTEPTWDDAQSYTNLGLIYLGFMNDTVFQEKGSLALEATSKNCSLAQSYIFNPSIVSVKFPYQGLTDVTPLQAFEYATNVKEVVVSVAPGVTMSCPLSDATRCKFIPFSDAAIRGLGVQ
jgi:hypothetical protein